MNQAAQDKLREVRQRLAELDPYPWEPVEAWIASAKPLIKAHYRDHFDDFLAVAATPHWYEAIIVVPGRYSDVDPRRGRSADHVADRPDDEDRVNARTARSAKKKILSFVDGLLDLPIIATVTPAQVSDSDQRTVQHYHMAPTFNSTIT